MTDETKLATVTAQPATLARAHQTPFAELRQMAKEVAASNLFGVKTESEAISLMLLAQAEGLHPMVAIRDYHIIDGKPSKKARAMLADFLAHGGRVEWHQRDDKAADATFSHPRGGSVRVRWTIEMARAVKDKYGKSLTDKANYKNYPRQMLSARCISEGVNAVDPGATSGLYTPEEVQDFDPVPQRTTASTYQAELMPAEAPLPAKNVTPTDPAPVDEAAAAQSEMKAKALATIDSLVFNKGMTHEELQTLLMTLGHADGTKLDSLTTREQFGVVYKAVEAWQRPEVDADFLGGPPEPEPAPAKNPNPAVDDVKATVSLLQDLETFCKKDLLMTTSEIEALVKQVNPGADCIGDLTLAEMKAFQVAARRWKR